jgi:ubiquitin carboxyl-terminal hydrolase 7
MFPYQEELLLFEEIKFEPNVMCETIDRRTTLSRCQLEDGDIICFQKNTSAEDQTAFRHKSVPDFLEYIRHRQVRQHSVNVQ